ncbi:MAG: hypothetical protein ACI9CU_001091 [Polaribacter sp.]|jgi:hypothetical protein
MPNEMKKLYTTLTALSLLSMVAVAQNAKLPVLQKTVNISKTATEPLRVVEARSPIVNATQESSVRGGLACAFDEDFEDGAFPAGWVNITNNASENWEWSATLGNPDGGMVILYDPTPANQNESLISPVIDFTSIPNPTLKFDWLMSYYWGVDPNDNYDVTIRISNDGITWIPVWTETDFGGVFDSYEWYTTNVDMSAYSTWPVAYLQFNYNGNDGAQANFDNISVCSAQNDLRVDKFFMGDIVNDYAYSQIPVSQAAEVITGVVISNVGGTALTNVLLDAELYSFMAAANVSTGTIAGPAVLLPGESDTVWVATGHVPAMIDTLIGGFTVYSDQFESTPLDNEGTEVLLITSDTWAHDYELEDYFTFGYVATDPIASTGFEMGATYFCQTSGSTIYAVDFPLGDATTAQTVTVKIYELDAVASTLVSSTLYDLVLPGDLSTTTVNFINVPLDVPVGMTAGNVYRATIAIEGGDDAYILGNNFDDGDGGQALYSATDDAWYNWVGLTTAMRLRVSSVVGLEENDGLASFNIYPNPTSENINVRFTTEESELVNVNVFGANGQLVESVSRTSIAGQTNNVTIDSKKFSTGVYTVQLIGNSTSSTKRVIVQ